MSFSTVLQLMSYGTFWCVFGTVLTTNVSWDVMVCCLVQFLTTVSHGMLWCVVGTVFNDCVSWDVMVCCWYRFPEALECLETSKSLYDVT